jgi:ABC-type nitrate/sulfonate/bicarbonate transport system ATPase subunit
MGIASIRDISKSYTFAGSTVRVLDSISFEIEANELLCIIGPKGCGKSTLLNILAGLDFPTAGDVTVQGHPVRRPSNECTVVFQDERLFYWKTVEANVEFGPKALGVSREERRQIARETLAMVGLTSHAQRYPFLLSGGEAQLVAIARALAVDPTLILMDEPFQALDSISRVAMQQELLRILELRKKTVVLVTHDLREAIYLADRIVVLGPPPTGVRTILANPLTRDERHHASSWSPPPALEESLRSLLMPDWNK